MTDSAIPERPPSRFDSALLALRVAVGFVFLVAGLKLIIPSLFGPGDDRAALVASFTDPHTGWIAPWLAERIGEFGISISVFLLIQGLVEVALALTLIVGLATPRVAAAAAMMLVMFTIAAPTGGAIRLSRDLALAAVALALAQLGGGHWSLDRLWARHPGGRLSNRMQTLAGVRRAARGGRRDPSLLLIRLGIAYTLLASAVFTGGMLDNPLNTTLPVPVALLAGLVLAAGLAPRYVMGGIAVWLLVASVGGVAEHGLLIGFETAKREIALLVAAAAYAAVGPDRFSLPQPRRPRCREVTDLLLAYVDGDLPPKQRAALEFHFGDCPDCWAFLGAYRHTVTLGKELRQDGIPAEVYARLEHLLDNPPANPTTA